MASCRSSACLLPDEGSLHFVFIVMSNESTICASEKVSEQPGLNTGASCQTMHGGHYARHKKKQHLAQQTRTKVGEFPELRRDRTSNADVQIQNK